MAAFLQVNPVAAQKAGLTNATFDAEVAKRITSYVQQYYAPTHLSEFQGTRPSRKMRLGCVHSATVLRAACELERTPMIPLFRRKRIEVAVLLSVMFNCLLLVARFLTDPGVGLPDGALAAGTSKTSLPPLTLCPRAASFLRR